MSNEESKTKPETKETKEEVSKIKKVLNIILNVLIWVFVAFSLVVTILVFTAQNNKDGVPSLFGKSLLTIQTGSMEPTYHVGDLVIAHKLTDVQKSQLKPGDIITFKSPVNDGPVRVGDLITHKVLVNDVEKKQIQTQGENSALQDKFTVSYDAVLGVCSPSGRVGGLGAAIDWLGSSEGFLICVVMPMFLFFVYELYNFINIIVVKKKTAQLSKEEEEEIKRKAVEEYLAKQNAANAAAQTVQEGTATNDAAQSAPAAQTVQEKEAPAPAEQAENKENKQPASAPSDAPQENNAAEK